MPEVQKLIFGTACWFETKEFSPINMKTDFILIVLCSSNAIEMRTEFSIVLLAVAAARSVSSFSYRATPAGTVNLSSSVERDVYSMAVSCI